MYADSSLLGLIPARGGSKGLSNKNILECAGKPLIEWSIEAALGVGYLDDVVVTTDTEAIATASLRAGATVPFLRPEALAGDDSRILDVISHAWENHLDVNGERFDYIVLLQPTSPLRTSAHIRDAIEWYFHNRSNANDTLASVYEVSSKHGWLMQTDHSNGYIRFCFDVHSGNPQRQNLSPYFLPNGAIFMVQGSAIEAGLYHHNTIPFVMAASDSIDIDSYDDFMSADKILVSRNSI